ncbi:MAG: cysteine desulfurase family protein [Bryobacterales bacterium]|nr:cysteine desulfurase [Bryobacteraceae bacterium]MDW8354537.1 cysteine desulfurase family protein [Bryobacterales bacterium]
MDRFYFDHNATTPVSAEVLEALMPVLGEVWGNASSIHYWGQAAKQRLETARRQLAALIGARPQEIVFLSGGTEADNLAILGTVRRAPKPRKHVITTAIEHPAVLAACAQLEREGVEVTYLPVSSDGVVDPDDVRRALRPETVLVSVMHANNEIGVVEPVAEIARLAHDAGAVVHSDGVQALGKVRVDVEALGVDLYSMSGHKIYAPKGIGALYVRRGTALTPILYGGHQERDRRPGTENVPGAVAFGAAAAWVQANWEQEAARLAALRDRLERGILERVPQATVNGGQAPRTPNTTNISFAGIEGEAMVIALDLKGFAVSTGSACSSGAIEPSHVLTALGRPPEMAKASVRFSLGRSNTEEQVDALIEAVAEVAERLRKLSPTYTHA